MPVTPLEQIQEDLKTLGESFDTKVAAMGEASSKVEAMETLIEELKTKITDGEATIEQLVEAKDEVKELRRVQEEKAAAFEGVVEQMSAMATRLDESEAAMKRLPQIGAEEVETLGAQFIESDQYKSWQDKGSGVSDRFEVKSLWPHRMKAGEITGASLGNLPSYLYVPSRVPGIIGPPELQPRVRDLFPVNRTSVGAIEFVRETGFTNAAATVAEVGTKPQSALAFESISIPIRTIAHWLPATRQIIADSAQLEAYINTRLLYGLALTEDDQLLNGDGTGSNLTGLLTDTDLQAITQGVADANDTKADVVRRAMTLGEVAGYPASGSVLHPNDWEDIELLKDNQGQYIWARVQESGVRRLWGQPVVTTVAISELTFATGSFALAAAIWDREESAIRVSDQHADFFVENLLAILAEERLALTVYRPEAMVLGTLTAAGS